MSQHSNESYHIEENGLYNQNIEVQKSSAGNDYYIGSQTCSETNVWFVWDHKRNSCICGDDLNGIVNCDSATKQVSVLDCYCLTIDYTTQGAIVGSCIFNCENSTQFKDILYHGVPSDCASLNRQGALCGQCLDGYAVPAYSYGFQCIKCDSKVENWGLYTTVAFLPLTVFIVITMVFRINVLSPKLNMFVFAAQNLSDPMFLRILLYTLSQTKGLALIVPVKLIATIYGIWNLDFLRVNVLPDVCINAIPLHILVLDYLVAVYPMIIMALAFIVVELYSFGFRPLLYIWKPFHHFFARFRRQWGIQTTIMDSFVTFFFLSITKFLSVSCDLLMGTPVFTRDGKLNAWKLYYDPSIQYFGRDHLPYALLAVVILILFIVFPISLLLFYQCKAYRTFLKRCQIQGTMLDAYMNTFQKYYKDGTNGTWDCRWFAAFFILIKSFMYLAYGIYLSEIVFTIIIILCIIGAIVIVVVKPYAEEYQIFNAISAIVLLWQAVYVGCIVAKNTSHLFQVALSDHYMSAMIASIIPLVYIFVVILHHLIMRFRRQTGSHGLSSSLPHRLLHSDQYRNSFGFIPALPSSSN